MIQFVAPRLLATMGAYLALYLALDWVTLIDPLGRVAITPWNPPAGLSFALLLRYGMVFMPVVFVAVAAGELVFHGLSALPGATFTAALIVTLGYGAAAAMLRRVVGFSPRFDSNRDLWVLLAAAICTNAALAPAVCSVFALAGLLAWDDFAAASLRFWVGDLIGIAVFTPFLLLMLERHVPVRLPAPATIIEYALQTAAIGIGLLAIFGLENVDHFELSYVLFLPLIWIALRDGLMGATWGIVATQLGLMLAVQWKGYGADIVTQFQLLMLAVAATGLFLGSVVDERGRAEMRLKQHEAELTRAAQQHTTGEMAAALAHELNQPLTALIAFARACQAVLQGPEAGTEAARHSASDLIDRAVQQAGRAGDIIRATRETFGRGDMRPAKADVYSIIDAALDLVRVEAAQNRTRISVQLKNPLPPVLADAIQIEQVLLNFLRNSMEAMIRVGTVAPQVDIAAAPAADATGFVEISVTDNGPGFPPEIADHLFTPFTSTKDSGMGLGMSICRSIIETHGGRISADPGRFGQGAKIRFTLPVYAEEANGA